MLVSTEDKFFMVYLIKIGISKRFIPVIIISDSPRSDPNATCPSNFVKIKYIDVTKAKFFGTDFAILWLMPLSLVAKKSAKIPGIAVTKIRDQCEKLSLKPSFRHAFVKSLLKREIF